MRNRIFSLFIALIIVCSAQGYNFKVDGLCYNIISETTVEVTYEYEPWLNNNVSYASLNGAVEIPNNVNYEGTNYSVVGIGINAFYGCNNIISISIPSSIKGIHDTFKNCSSLIAINVGDGNGTFCSENGILFDNEKKVLIKYPSGKSDLTYNIPENVKFILTCAFEDCGNLVSVNIPNSVEGIEDSAFKGCSSLESVIIPASITDIEFSVFENCNSLVSVTMPEGLESINDWAFKGCSTLREITIPSSVIKMTNNVFESCSSLQAVNVEAGNCNYCSEDGVLFNIDKTVLILYPDGKTENSYNIPETVTKIEGGAFDDCCSLIHVTIPDGVESIENYTFSGCTNLVDIPVGRGIKHIGAYAFADCTSFVKINIPKNVVNIKYEAFSGCTNLVSARISNSVAYLGYGVFSGCSRLTSVNIPNNVTMIEHDTFEQCSNLESIVFPAGVRSISHNSFANCIGLQKMTLLGTVPPNIESYTFEGVDRSIPIYVPATSIESFQTGLYWNEFTNYHPIDGIILTLGEGGAVVYDDKFIIADTVIIPDVEADLRLQVVADDGFELERVIFDGMDYTTQVGEDGMLILPTSERSGILQVVYKMIYDENQICICDENQRTVFLKAPHDYDSTVYAYIWAENSLVDIMPGWPGSKAIVIGNGYYKFNIPEDWGEPQADWMIIWNDGKGGGYIGGEQTEDLLFCMRGLYAGDSFDSEHETGVVSNLCSEDAAIYEASLNIQGGDYIVYKESKVNDGFSFAFSAYENIVLYAPTGYMIESAIKDGEVLTIEDNCMVIYSTLPGNTDLSISLKPIGNRVSVYYEGSDVVLWNVVDYMDSFTCNIATLPGYQLQSVTLNGEDVMHLLDDEGRLVITGITEEKTLIVSSIQNGGATDYILSDMNYLRAWQANGTIFAEVDDNVATLQLYDVSGRLMNEYRHNGNYQVITLPAPNEVNILKVVGKDGSITAHKLM